MDLPKTQPVKQLEGKPNSSFNDDSLGQASIPSQFIASQQEFYKKPVNIKLNPMPPLANTGQFNFPDISKTMEAKQTINTQYVDAVNESIEIPPKFSNHDSIASEKVQESIAEIIQKSARREASRSMIN